MRLHRDPVKHSTKSPKQKGVWQRWLEGWELVVPSVGVAALAAWLALPQPTMPRYLPLPTLEPPALERARGRLQRHAELARLHPLPFEVRAVGERFRQLGRAIHAGIAVSMDERQRYRNQVIATQNTFGAERLLELRAIQTELFANALSTWETTGKEGVELIELGGDFLAQAAKEDWLSPKPAPTSSAPKGRAHLKLEHDERRAVFLLRWTDLAGLLDESDFRLEPSWIVLASQVRLRRPLEKLSAAELPIIDRVSHACPDYPGDVAKGLLLARLGALDAAAESFREYLTQHVDDAFTVRARNHLLFVQEQASGSLP